jgi:hypothetical protein
MTIPRISGRQASILIAEDSPTQSMNLQYLLERHDCQVTACANGAEALAHARKHKPDVIISDIVMPLMNGYELCRALKSDPGLRDVPVLLVTSLNDPEDVLRGLDAGADSFILKPYEENFLINRVRFVMVHRQMRRVDRGEIGLEINLNDRTHFITSDRLQILNLLLSTYEAAIQRNDDLRRSEEELRAANAALRNANAQLLDRATELEQANRELEAFTYTISHDLRTPLRHINAYAGMLDEEAGAELPASARQYIREIHQSTRHMSRLMDELLTFSRLGRKPVERMPVDMTDIATRALQDVQDDRYAFARVDLGALPPAQADPLLLRQVWTNLLSNALKYSAPLGQEARIEVRGEIVDGYARYTVRDNGVGFDPQYADRLFGVFQRLHSNEQFEGTGVGLAIVERIIRRHGGHVSADSRPGQGAIFTFELPLVEDATPPGLPAERAAV